MKQLLLLSLLFLSISCKQKENNSIAEKPENNIEKKKSNQFSFLDEYKFEKVTIKDSTNFDNYFPQKKLSKEQIKLLGINKIVVSRKLEEINNVGIRYKLNLSDDFNSIVISFQSGEHELFTVLANYSPEYSLIDWEYISYDEIAEGLIRIESEISKNKIVVFKNNYYNEVSEVETTFYNILKNGKIEE